MSKKGKTCAYCARRGKASVQRRNFIIRTCNFCGGQFQIPAWRVKQGRGNFCSRECKDRFLTTLTGQNSIRWRGGTAGSRRGIGWWTAREWATVRACGKCEQCGKQANGHELTVHHIKPYRECRGDMEANSPKNLISLCRACHSKADNLGKVRTCKGQFQKRVRAQEAGPSAGFPRQQL